MIYRTLLVLLITISPAFAAKKAEFHLTDIISFKYGKWKGEMTYNYPTGQTATVAFKYDSYKSKNGKLSISKGSFGGEGWQLGIRR